MLLSGEKAEEVFRKIKEVREYMRQYCLAPDRAELSVEDLQRCICEMYGLKIEKLEVPFDAEYVRGMVERYKDGRARILIRKDQSEDWKRFVATKELCHLMVDEKDDWSTAGTRTIETFLYESSLTGSESQADPIAQSEIFALVAAIEMVYPHGDRAADIENLKTKALTIRKIALHYQIPDYAVSVALNPRHLESVRQIWEIVNS